MATGILTEDIWRQLLNIISRLGGSRSSIMGKVALWKSEEMDQSAILTLAFTIFVPKDIPVF
jgi:hypothetical protein